RTLFRRLGVSPGRVVSYHEHNERARAGWLIERLRAGEDVALVPEAGTPLVSDPGFRLVRAAAHEGISVVALPGPSAVLAELRAELGSLEQVRGEMTVVIEGAGAPAPELDARVDEAILALLAEGLGPRAIRDALAPVVDAPKATIYNRAVELSR